jgi:hypothetical protein
MARCSRSVDDGLSVIMANYEHSLVGAQSQKEAEPGNLVHSTSVPGIYI